MVREETRANLSRLDDVIGDLRSLLSRLEPACLGGTEAAMLLARFAEVERLGVAVGTPWGPWRRRGDWSTSPR
jgi:hypothetical protein